MQNQRTISAKVLFQAILLLRKMYLLSCNTACDELPSCKQERMMTSSLQRNNDDIIMHSWCKELSPGPSQLSVTCSTVLQVTKSWVRALGTRLATLPTQSHYIRILHLVTVRCCTCLPGPPRRWSAETVSCMASLESFHKTTS